MTRFIHTIGCFVLIDNEKEKLNLESIIDEKEGQVSINIGQITTYFPYDPEPDYTKVCFSDGQSQLIKIDYNTLTERIEHPHGK